MLEEIRIGSLGVIDSSTLELGPGLTVITGETGAGKTMIVTALGLLLGGRADTGAVRTGARAARVEGVVRAGRARRLRRARSRTPGERSRTTAWCWPATSPPRAAPARSSAAPRCPCRVLAEVGRAAGRGARPVRPAPAAPGRAPSARRSTASAASRSPRCWPTTPSCTSACSATERELDEVVATARERARRPTCCGSGSARSRRSRPSPARTPPWRPRRPGWASPTRCAPPPSRPARRSPATRTQPDALATTSAARTLLDGVRDHDAEAGELADRLAELTYLLSDVAADVASYASRLETDPARLAARLRAPGGADRADPQVRRDHRRGARLGRAVGDPARSTSTTPTSGSRSCAPSAPTCASGWAPPRRRCRRRAPPPRPGWPTRSPPS